MRIIIIIIIIPFTHLGTPHVKNHTYPDALGTTQSNRLQRAATSLRQLFCLASSIGIPIPLSNNGGRLYRPFLSFEWLRRIIFTIYGGRVGGTVQCDGVTRGRLSNHQLLMHIIQVYITTIITFISFFAFTLSCYTLSLVRILFAFHTVIISCSPI